METLEAYRDALVHGKEGSIAGDQIEKAIIGTVGKDEKPLDPGDKGLSNFKRKLTGITDEIRQRHRDAILSVDRDALAQAAEMLLGEFDAGVTVVLSSAQAIQKAAATTKDLGQHVVEISV